MAVEIAEAGKEPKEHVKEMADICRKVGIVKKLGTFNLDDTEKAENLNNAELSGVGYAQRTAVAFWESEYHKQYPEKVGQCVEFAHAALKVFYPDLACKEMPKSVPVFKAEKKSKKDKSEKKEKSEKKHKKDKSNKKPEGKEGEPEEPSEE